MRDVPELRIFEVRLISCDMKREYDFSNAERGKFYRPNATLSTPVYLDKKVQSYLSERAKSKGIDIGELVNQMLKHDIDLVETIR